MNVRWRTMALTVVAPLGATVLSLVLTAVVLAVSGESPIAAYRAMWEYGTQLDSLVSTVNRAVPLYLSAVAVAIGFKMGLFNIGVEGQYRLAALVAAAAGAAVSLPAPLHVSLVLLVGMATGAAWAGIAGVLKVTRGVNEVISTIMLNTIAVGISAYMLTYWFRVKGSTDTIVRTRELPRSARIGDLNRALDQLGFTVPVGTRLLAFVLIAAAVGALFHIIIFRTRFGFDLRASGLNPIAARASGVHPRAVTVQAMLLSGAVAGLVGLPQVMSFSHAYTQDLTAGLGFTGIAVALLGRNHPVGIAFGALLFGFLDRATGILDLEGIPKEILAIMQGTIILSVVIAYEVVRRLVQASEQRAAGAQTGEPPAAVAVPA